MYDTFSSDYDRFVNWNARLAVEMPFIEQKLQEVKAVRVLDAACGTGKHAIALAQRGYSVVGADLSAGMVAQARKNIERTGVAARFEVAGFGELASRLNGSFDALLCLGNSLPHVLDTAQLAAALQDFAACLRPGGLLLIQNRNFDCNSVADGNPVAVIAQRERWMEPQSHQEGDAEWLFLRFYDYLPDEKINFNVVTLKRTGAEGWKQQVTTTPLRPIIQAELSQALEKSGFEQIVGYGNMAGAPFDPKSSGNLVVTAIRK